MCVRRETAAWTAVLSLLILSTNAALSLDAAEKSAVSSSGPFIQDSEPCGTADDLHFCGVLTSKGPPSITIPAMKITYLEVGRALVTWTGSVYCSVPDELSRPVTLQQSRREYFVHLALKDDGTQTVEYNGKGNASIGEVNNLAVATNYVMDNNTRIWPVTLTKVFNVKRNQKANYRVLAVRDFRREHFGLSGFCNLNGGSVTITFMPQR